MSIIVGIDVSKASFEAHMQGKARSFANSKSGFAQLYARDWSTSRSYSMTFGK
jgi:transposase